MSFIGNNRAGEQARLERQEFEAEGERHQWEDELVKDAKAADYNRPGAPSLVARIRARLHIGGRR